tara:strand:+ start:233 stop:589 length:357 start_codon:yes stop_codon:yes gene_type:complete
MDGSLVLHYHKDSVNQDELKKEYIMNKFDEVYGITEGININPIVGTYFCIGSGNYIIVSNDAIYEYYNNYDTYKKCYTGMVLKRCDPLTLLNIIDVEQSEGIYISYLKFMFKNGKIID